MDILKRELEGEKIWEDFVVEEDLKRMKKYHDLPRKDPSLAPRKYTFRLRDCQGNIKHIQSKRGHDPKGRRRAWPHSSISLNLKKLKGELKRVRKSTRLLWKQPPNGIIVLDKNGRILEVNKKALKLSGFKREDLIGKNIIRILPKIKLDPEEIISGLKLAIKGKNPIRRLEPSQI